MNRRAFLRVLGLAPVAVPAAVNVLATAPAPKWVPIQWWAKEFDYGHFLGVAVQVRHTLTAEVRRRAVRITRQHDVSDDDAVSKGVRQLQIWINHGAGDERRRGWWWQR